MVIQSKAIMKVFGFIFLIGLLILSLPAPAKPAYAQSFSTNFADVDAYINETMRTLPIKGAALAIVKGDQIIYQQGYGTANAQGDPATPQTPWPMASVTKSFTALAIRQLAVEKKVDLNAPVQTYLPEFRLSDEHAASIITIRHLLDHTSGISKQEGEAPYLNSPATTYEEAIDRLAKFRPEHKPGEIYEYCNWNYVLLGQVVSRVSGQPYTEYVQQKILEPLDMSHSTFSDFHLAPHAASGNLISFGVPFPYDEKYVPGMIGASQLTSTSEDMAHFVSLFLGEGKYLDQSLLPAKGSGSYDPMWNWVLGNFGTYAVNGLSGGHNSISTTCLTYPQQELGVVLLLNTRLDQLPGVSAYDIALGIGNIILQRPLQALPKSAFYTPWVILDVSILLLVAAIAWQIFRLKGWRNRYQSSKVSEKVLSWAGIVFGLLICIAIIYLPTMLSTRWDTLLFMRPDIAIPLVSIAALLGAIGLYKGVRSRV